MTQKWDDIKLKIEKFASTAADKASEITKDAAEKAEQLTKQGKIKLDIYQLEKSKDKEFLQLGKILFRKISTDKLPALKDDKEVHTIVKQIQKIDKDIDIEKEKLNNIKTNKKEEKTEEKKEQG
jgi:hypothetical protein